MFTLFLQAIWLGLPAGFANMAPPVMGKLFPRWNYPVDFYKTYRGIRLFGLHKTIRGIILGTIVGEIVFLLQLYSYTNSLFLHLNILPYSNLPWYFGFLFGIGALGGDLVKSFFKRQLRISEGKTWFPFDQIDWLLGTLLVLIVFVKIPIAIIVVSLFLGILLHMFAKGVGYLLGLDSHAI